MSVNHATLRKELRRAISRKITERKFDKTYNKIHSFRIKLRHEKERNLSLIREAQRQAERAETAEMSLKLIEADNRDLIEAHRRIGELERELAAVRDGRTIDNDEGAEIIIELRRQLEAAEWQDAGFCPHCHADELRQSTDLYDDELNLSVIVYRCGACGALWAGDANEWVRLVKRFEAAADAETGDWYAKRAFAAEARVKELEADLRSVPVMELMRAYPAVRWYVFNDEIRIRKWVEHIEELYAEWVKEQQQTAQQPTRA